MCVPVGALARPEQRVPETGAQERSGKIIGQMLAARRHRRIVFLRLIVIVANVL